MTRLKIILIIFLINSCNHKIINKENYKIKTYSIDTIYKYDTLQYTTTINDTLYLFGTKKIIQYDTIKKLIKIKEIIKSPVIKINKTDTIVKVITKEKETSKQNNDSLFIKLTIIIFGLLILLIFIAKLFNKLL